MYSFTEDALVERLTIALLRLFIRRAAELSREVTDPQDFISFIRFI